MAGEVAWLVQCLSSKCAALSSNPSTYQKKKSEAPAYVYMSSILFMCITPKLFYSFLQFYFYLQTSQNIM
jgi:hypothetical protein